MSAAGPAPARELRGRRRADAGENFRLLADFAPVMIWVASPDRKCVYFNRPWLDFTGRAAESQLGHGWMDLVHPEDRAGLTAAHEAAFAALAPFELEFRLRRHDGEHRWLIDKGVPIVDAGKLRGYVGSALDITERRAAEEAARKREDERRSEQLAKERNARANAESATLARDQFLA